jgi:hypothetical protein
MKKLLVLLFMLTAFISCYNEDPKDTFAPNQSPTLINDFKFYGNFKDENFKYTFDGTNKFSIAYTYVINSSSAFIVNTITYWYQIEIDATMTHYRYKVWFDFETYEDFNKWSAWYAYTFSGATLIMQYPEGNRELIKQ